MDIKTLCLGGLILGDASGYDLKKLFEDGPFSRFHHASFGSIYPALAALLKDGQVTCCEEAQGGRPDKKTYAITEAGRETFRRGLADDPSPDRVRSESLFMLCFADFLDEAHRAEVFQGYLDHYRRHVAFMKGLDDEGLSDGRRFVRGFGLAFYEAATRYMEENADLILKSKTDAAGAHRPAARKVGAG